ncbi:MAG: hypothetical protein Q8L39_15285 [Burkholderiales bacterium]|nr:hypothetical protein [Burkholderiales bacterium]
MRYTDEKPDPRNNAAALAELEKKQRTRTASTKRDSVQRLDAQTTSSARRAHDEHLSRLGGK